MATQFKLPQLGEGVEDAEISRIYVQEGDTIEADQNVMELETEKAVADLPCPHAGEIRKIHVAEGDTVEVGQTLFDIEETEEGEAPEGDEQETRTREEKGDQAEEEEQGGGRERKSGKKKKKDKEEKQEKKEEKGKTETGEEQPAQKKGKRKRGQQSEPSKPPPGPEATTTLGGRRAVKGQTPEQQPVQPPAGPATRRLARKLGVDLHRLAGGVATGERITSEDVVRAYAAEHPGAPAGTAMPPLPDFSKFGPVEREPLNKIGRTAAEHLAASWPLVPQVTQHDLADITELETARKQHASGEADPKITLTAIAIAAAVVALKEFPRFNSSLDWQTKEVVLKQYYHIGVAVDTEHGLLIPVITDADQKSIVQLASELAELAERARERKLEREQMQGGTFTVSNQGGLGGTAFTPIVNYPQVAILGLSRAAPQWELIDGQPQSRLKLPLSLSYDHRVINGADAARFVTRLASLLSDEFGLLVRV
jgi:pyruvate dehydrogenase E2 component (dihydrolipoamide acetyltransferase)